MSTTLTSSNSGLAALGSIFGTVTSIATTISGSTDMLNKYVAKESLKQADAHKADLADYKDRLAIESAERVMQRHLRVQKFLASNPEGEEIFKTAHKKFLALLNPEQPNS